MDKKLLAKILIIGIPTYSVALSTNAMVYTMPMLAITTIIATNIFDDVKEKPNKIECYINFGDPSLADLELQTEDQNFVVNQNILDKGFKKSDFVKIKKRYCSWDFFN